jgi:hypothetical protein
MCFRACAAAAEGGVCASSALQVMSARIHPEKGSVNYAPEVVERTPVARAMGIFNALTTVLFAYGKSHISPC